MTGEGAINEGTIVRDKLWFDDGFTMVPNSWLDDERLSAGAFMILVRLTRHSAGYKVTMRGLQVGMPHGYDFVRQHVYELERWGYLKRYRRRISGRFQGYTWHLMDPFRPVDKPQAIEGLFEPVEVRPPSANRENGWSEPGTGFPSTAKPSTAKPSTVQPHSKEEQIKNTYGLSSEVTPEGDAEPVDNSDPSAALEHSDEWESEAQSARPSGAASGVAVARHSRVNVLAAACPSRRVLAGPHAFHPVTGICDHCGRDADYYRHPIGASA